MNQKSKLLVSFAASIAIILSPVVVAAAEYNAYSASCSDSGISSFKASKRGFYTYVWRTGSTVNGGGVVYLSRNQEFSMATPASVEVGSRFGVLTTSTTFAYVTCID